MYESVMYEPKFVISQSEASSPIFLESCDIDTQFGHIIGSISIQLKWNSSLFGMKRKKRHGLVLFD